MKDGSSNIIVVAVIIIAIHDNSSNVIGYKHKLIVFYTTII